MVTSDPAAATGASVSATVTRTSPKARLPLASSAVTETVYLPALSKVKSGVWPVSTMGDPA